MTQSLRLIELITAQGIDLLTFLELAGYLIIPMGYVILPVATMVSAIYTLNNFMQHWEIIILQVSGLSAKQIIKPFVILSIGIVIIHYAISFYFMPKSYREFKNMQNFFKNSFVSAIFEEGVFNSPGNAITIYTQKNNPDNTFGGLLIYDLRNPMQPTTTIANRGQLNFIDKDSLEFTLHNGTHQIENKRTGKISLTLFEVYKFTFQNTTVDAIPEYIDANELFIHQLLNKSDANEKDLKNYKVHAVQRIIWPSYNIMLTVLVIALLINTQTFRKSNRLKIAATSLTGGVVISLFLLFNNLALRNYSMMPMLIVVTLLGFVAAFTVMRYNDRA